MTLSFNEREVEALESIAKSQALMAEAKVSMARSLEKLANPPQHNMEEVVWVTAPNPDDLQNMAREHERLNKL